MLEFERFARTDEFKDWLKRLDEPVGARINKQLDKYETDGRLPVTSGLTKKTRGIGELRFKFGTGYRVYFCHRGKIVILLLCGGDKDTQADDLATDRVFDSSCLKAIAHLKDISCLKPR